MRNQSILSAGEFAEIRELAEDARLYTAGLRGQLLDGFDADAVASITVDGSPLIQLSIDLRWVTDHERLADGSFPLLLWLKNAARLTKPFSQGAAFQQWVDIISARPASWNGSATARVPHELPRGAKKFFGRDDAGTGAGGGDEGAVGNAVVCRAYGAKRCQESKRPTLPRS